MNWKIFLGLILIFVVACTNQSNVNVSVEETGSDEMHDTDIDDMMEDEDIGEMMDDTAMHDSSETVPDAPAWQDIELKDVRTGDSFRISEFRGKPVLIESFAVWCPTCLKQQKEIQKFHEDVGDEVVSISLDTDPNEDENKVKEHIENNGFDWLYAVSPVELTQGLIDEFGVSVVNAPGAPVVLICEDGNSRFLDRGVKDPSKLKSEIAEGC